MKRLLAILLCCVGCSKVEAEKPRLTEPCRICGNEVSIKATTCPHCGEEAPSKTFIAREKSRLEKEARDRQAALEEIEFEQAKDRAFLEQEALRPIKESIVAMERVKERIDQYIAKNGKWPDDDAGKRIAFDLKDGWGGSLHFEFIDADKGIYVTFCSGGDGSLRREYVMAKLAPRH